GIYHCPADKSTVQTRDGDKTAKLRTRSYSMNGSINCQTTRETIPYYKKLQEIIDPAPTDLFVFLDVQEDSITDAHFGLVPPVLGQKLDGSSSREERPPSAWGDLPADRHNQ